MPFQKLKPPSNYADLAWAIVALIAMSFILLSVGCMTMPSGPEPQWSPLIYRFKNDQGRCTFYNPGLKHSLDCDEPLIQDYVLIHASQLTSLAQKFNMCRSWK